jgi:outer membrane protein assembly factor BamB
MRSTAIAICLLNLAICCGGDLSPSVWTEFRNGGSSISSGPMPLTWSPENGIAWQKELPGYGQSSPVIFNGRVFVTSVVGPMKDECQIVCLDLETGEQVWEWKKDASSRAASNYMASRAAPTPLVDANGVYAFFESGDFVAINPDGSLKWSRSLTDEFGKFDNNHGLGSSPTQTTELVIVNIEHKGPSYLLAVDKQTGETRWKADRPSGSSWTSPIVVQQEGNEQVIVSSGGSVSGYSTVDGKQKWSFDGISGNSVPSPTVAGPYLYVGARIPEFGSAEEASQSNLCLRLDFSETPQNEVLWRAKKAVCDYASPVIHGDCVYYLNNVGVLYCVDSLTGETQYTERLGTTCWATPVASGENVYFFGKDGKTVVIKSGPVFSKVATNLLWDPRNAPAPEFYKEHQSAGHGHGFSADESKQKTNAANTPVAQEKQDGADEKTDRSPPKGEGSGRTGGPGGGMMATLMKSDANGDGKISEEELSPEFREMMGRIDLNKDKFLDADELKAMEENFRKRREGSKDSARDPIVYGVAAADGAFVIRTGTRLFCVRSE